MKSNNDFVVCVKAKPYKMSIDLVFQSLSDEKVFYKVRRDVMTNNLVRICFNPDHPKVFIIRSTGKRKIKGIYYGYKDFDAFSKHKKDLLFNKPVATYKGQVFLWIFLPIILASLFIVILNYAGYHFW